MKIQEGTFTKIASQHNAHGGGTFNALNGESQKSAPYYAVSILPQRTHVIDGAKLTKEDVSNFVRDNFTILLFSGGVKYIGTWFNAGENKTYIDIVVLIPIRLLTDAANIARYNKQIAFYDLQKDELLYVGGNGKGTVSEEIVLDILHHIPSL